MSGSLSIELVKDILSGNDKISAGGRYMDNQSNAKGGNIDPFPILPRAQGRNSFKEF